MPDWAFVFVGIIFLLIALLIIYCVIRKLFGKKRHGDKNKKVPKIPNLLKLYQSLPKMIPFIFVYYLYKVSKYRNATIIFSIKDAILGSRLQRPLRQGQRLGLWQGYRSGGKDELNSGFMISFGFRKR